MPHADDVRYASPEVLFDEVNLIDDFADGEVAGEPFVARSAENAFHRAADLRREAYGESLARGVGRDSDCLDKCIVGKLEHVLSRSVD